MWYTIVAAAMPSWAVVLASLGIVVGVGVLVYVVFRWGTKNKTVTQLSLSGASAIFSVLKSVFKDKPDELDVHDFMKAFDALAKAGLDCLKQKEAGASFESLKAMMLVRVREIADSFHNLKDSITDEHIEKAVDAFFVVVGFIPKVSDISKK